MSMETEYTDARRAGAHARSVARYALDQVRRSTHQFRIGRLSQITETLAVFRRGCALGYMEAAREARSEMIVMLNFWRSRDGFMDGWNLDPQPVDKARAAQGEQRASR